MYRFDGIDYFKMAKEIDVASWDNYPTWHKPTETVEETALDTAMMHDLYYSMKGKPFLLLINDTPNCYAPSDPKTAFPFRFSDNIIILSIFFKLFKAFSQI